MVWSTLTIVSLQAQCFYQILTLYQMIYEVSLVS